MRTETTIRTDLSKLAIERCRKAFMSVGQLIDDDDQRIALLVAVAVDMTRGAGGMIAECHEGISEEQALATAVTNLLRGLGVKISDTAIEARR
jgi:hypothetical protein